MHKSKQREMHSVLVIRMLWTYAKLAVIKLEAVQSIQVSVWCL